MEAEPTEPRPKPDRRRLYLILVPIIGFTIMGYVGDALAAGLVKRHPLWLIALNPRKRYLALVVPHADPVPYYIVGLLRQFSSDPLFFLLGRWYGDAGVRWLERKLGEGGSLVRFMERGFAKASWPMVAIFPNYLMCMLAGASNMPTALFLVLNIGGTIAAITLLRTVGDVFGSPLRAFTNFLDDYRWPLIAISTLAVAYTIWSGRKQGRSELELPSEIERELKEESD